MKMSNTLLLTLEQYGQSQMYPTQLKIWPVTLQSKNIYMHNISDDASKSVSENLLNPNIPLPSN